MDWITGMECIYNLSFFIMFVCILWYLTDLCYSFCVAGLPDCVSYLLLLICTEENY